ncbi:hypothetical protein LX32DRAFT_112219 [Colletotrichum zoysiae]|uniref:Uncharacterized protein n=1 Tax=Colletotrichum zoysiae TaxID=1216348 RepID=A0AAD9H9E7_9PEZI|nr:hypothetical protein LX32DRAFT_112219 [Colletotrichum zoysiae]
MGGLASLGIEAGCKAVHPFGRLCGYGCWLIPVWSLTPRPIAARAAAIQLRQHRLGVFRLQPPGQGGPREFVQCAPNVDIWRRKACRPVGKRLASGRAIPIPRVARRRGTGIMVPPLFWIKKVRERPRPPKRRQRPNPDSDHQSPCLVGSVLSARPSPFREGRGEVVSALSVIQKPGVGFQPGSRQVTHPTWCASPECFVAEVQRCRRPPQDGK